MDSYWEQLAGFLLPELPPERLFYVSSCVGAFASAESGSPIARKSSSSSNPVAIRWLTSRRATSPKHPTTHRAHQPTPTERSEMARLLSVNVGLPHDIEWKGRIVNTGNIQCVAAAGSAG